MKINFQIAANAQGVTLGKYIDYQNAVDKVEQVRIITGKSRNTINLLQMSVIDEIIDSFEAAIKLTGTEFQRKVKVNVTEYGFIPNLSEMTFGEYVDLDTVCAELYKDGVINANAALKMMCILYRPIKAKFGKYYDIEPYSTKAKRGYEEDIREFTLDTVLNALVFFSTLELELYNASLEFLEKEITEIVKEMTQEQHQTA